MSIALVRYLAADAVRGQRWVAPLLCYLVVVSVITAGGGSALSGYSATSAALFPIALWLAIVVTNSEESVQAAVTVVTVGSAGWVRLTKLAVAYLSCLPLTLVALSWPIVAGHPFTVRGIAAGVGAHLVTALVGVAFGGLLSRPIINRIAWAVLAGVAISLAQLLTPHIPPVRQLLDLLGSGQPHGLAGPLALTTVQAVALSALVIAVAHRLARVRT